MDIAEILKYCPKGTKLYSSIYGDCFLKTIRSNDSYPIVVVPSSFDIEETFTKEGKVRMFCNGECVLFPSKNQKDWKKFRLPANDGDIMMLPEEEKAFIFKKYIGDNENLEGLCADYYCGINEDNEFLVKAKDFH